MPLSNIKAIINYLSEDVIYISLLAQLNRPSFVDKLIYLEHNSRALKFNYILIYHKI